MTEEQNNNYEIKLKVVIYTNSWIIKTAILSLLSELYNDISIFDDTAEFEKYLKFNSHLQGYLIFTDLGLTEEIESIIIKTNIKYILLPFISVPDYQKTKYYKFSIDIFDSKEFIIENIQRANDEIILNNENKKTEILSKREIDIITYVAKGYSSQMIAEKLYISLNTVNTHRKNISNKLGIKTVSGQTAYAIINNLIRLDEAKLV